MRDPCQALHLVSYLCLCCLLPSHRKFMRLHTFSLSFDYIMKNTTTSEAVEGPAYRNEVILTSLEGCVSFDFSVQRVSLTMGKIHVTPDKIISYTCSEMRPGFFTAGIGCFPLKIICQNNFA